MDISYSNCNVFMSEKQNDVQFKQKDIKYGHKVKRNEELCINHLVMNS